MVKIQTLPLAAFDPVEFLMKLGKKERLPVLLQSGEWTIVAWNPIKTFHFSSAKKAKSTLEQIAKKRRKNYNGQLPFIGGLIGYCSADLGYEILEITPQSKNNWHLPLVHAGLYEDAILWDGEKLHCVGSKKFEREVREIYRREIPQSTVQRLKFRPSISYADYAKDFRKIQKYIHNGDVYQLNYTYTYEALSTSDSKTVFDSLIRNHPAPHAAYIDSGSTQLLSLSPERFIRIENSTIVTCPIKGTRPRGKNAADDKRLRSELLKSEKEAAELNMITDLLRNDIGKIAAIGSVRVAEQRMVTSTSSVWHTSSKIEAQLDAKISPITALFSMLPGGSVTGCPKKRAVELIDQLEPVRRGPYTGAIFFLSDHAVLDSSIIIRTLVHKKNRYSLGVGGGIVADSIVRNEWEETRQKAGPFLAASPRPATF